MTIANPAAADAPAVGTIVQVDFAIADNRKRFLKEYYRVMYSNEFGFLLAPPETAQLEISVQPDGTTLYPEARPAFVWLANDGNTNYVTNAAIELNFYDARAGIPVFDPDTAEYWPLEEFFPAYFGVPLEDAVPLNLMSPDFAQDMLSQMFQGGDVITLVNCGQSSLATFAGVPLQVLALSQSGVLCVPAETYGDPNGNGVFVPFDGSVVISRAQPGTYSFSNLVGGDTVLYQGNQLAVETFYPQVLNVPFDGPSMLCRVVEEQVIEYEPGYVIETSYYEPYWSPCVSVGIGFGFPVIIF
jgi:hypothetical protein